MQHALRTRAVALLALLLVALPLGAAGQSQYFCRTMERLMDACCCPGGRSAESASVRGCVSEIKRQDCCQLLERTAKDGVPALREGAFSLVAAAIATAPTFVSVVSGADVRGLGAEHVQARAPPRATAPIFLKNCSLLT